MIGTRKPFTLIDATPVLTDGEHVANEVVILNSWAEVRMKRGLRQTALNQTQMGSFFEFRFRYRGDISMNANIRIQYNGVKYTPQSIERENEKAFYWKVLVEAKGFE